MWGNKDLVGKEHRWEDLYLANYIKEMFLDSDTVMAVITGLPARDDSRNVLTPGEIVESRAEINGLAKSKRVLAHGLFSPDMGKSDLEAMHRQFEKLKIKAWKDYPGQPFADGSVGWWMDDEKIAYPAMNIRARLGSKTSAFTKGCLCPAGKSNIPARRMSKKRRRIFPI
jgi:uncharacterized protein